MAESAEKYNATVVGMAYLTRDLFILKVKPDIPPPPFTCGQYVLLGLSSNVPRREDCPPEFKPAKPDRMVLRAYSIASAGQDTGILEFYVSVVANGSLTPRLVGLAPGDRLQVGDKIRGFFTLDAVPAGHDCAILASTGTGLAPYLSMLRGLRHGGPRPPRLIVLHGAPRSWELGYQEEMRALAHFLPGVTYVPSITRTQEDPWWTGDTGRITRYFQDTPWLERAGVRLDPAATSVFLCGNPAMIEEVSALLQPLGYSKHTPHEPGSLHTEEYW